MRREKVGALEGIRAFDLSLKQARPRCLKGAEKNVLRCLCDHYPKIWPSVETLAIESGWSVRSVRRALRMLEADGWMVNINGRRGGTGNSAQYRVIESRILDAFAAQDET